MADGDHLDKERMPPREGWGSGGNAGQPCWDQKKEVKERKRVKGRGYNQKRVSDDLQPML